MMWVGAWCMAHARVARAGGSNVTAALPAIKQAHLRLSDRLPLPRLACRQGSKTAAQGLTATVTAGRPPGVGIQGVQAQWGLAISA